MASLAGEAGWLRVRSPMVPLTPETFAALERDLRAFAIDPTTD